MKFTFLVEVEVKNDAITREVGDQELAVMLQAELEDNKMSTLPWVLIEHYARVHQVPNTIFTKE